MSLQSDRRTVDGEILAALRRLGPQSIEQLQETCRSSLAATVTDGQLSRALEDLVRLGQIIIWQVDVTLFTVMLRGQTVQGQPQVGCRL